MSTGRPDRREDFQALLDSFPRLESARTSDRHASVAITLVRDAAAELCFLLTRRAAGLRAHPGQFALPGGGVDEGETVAATALRELHEELGVRCDSSAVLGQLDDYVTRSGYRITPVVVWAADEPVTLVPSPAEVARVFEVPLTELDAEPTFVPIPESTNPVIQLPMLSTMVHAPTAAMLYQFGELVLRGRTTRVAELEQPVFAWR